MGWNSFAIVALQAAKLSLLSASGLPGAQNGPRTVSAVLDGPTLADRIQRTTMDFARDSIAYTTDGRMVPAAKPRFQKIAILNRPEYEVVGQCSRESIVALARCGGYFWGAQPWASSGVGRYLFRSLDAVKWEAVDATERGTIQSLYVTEAGRLLVGARYPGGVCIWDPNTESLTRVLTMLSEDPYPEHWNWAELNGRVYVGEYGSKYGSNNARRIYRSSDGGWNWDVLWDPPAQQGYHIHRVLADPYRTHLYWSHGDLAGSELFRSSDEGQSWQLLSKVEQPTAGIARPEGTYFGADNWGIGVYRFIDGSESGEFVCTNLVKGFIWDMREFNGVIYATSVNHEYYGPPSVVISRDGKHWGNLYQ